MKLPEPAPNTQHVENVTPPAVEGDVPSGVSTTEEGKEKGLFIGSIDCGTTSSRFLIFNREGIPVASHQIEFENMYPESG